MRIVLDNSTCDIVTGGQDNLVPSGDLLNELRDYMSIKIPGAYHSLAYKRHVWDGKKYFITPKGKMGTGFLPILLKYMDEIHPSLPVTIEDIRTNPVSISPTIKKTIGDHSLEGKYSHQASLVKVYNHSLVFRGQTIPFPRGVIDAATNAGKTTIFASVYANAVGNNPKMLLLINSRAVYRQLVQFFIKVFGEVGEINDQKFEPGNITIAMVQTLSNRVSESVSARDLVYSFDILAVDECHNSATKTYGNVLKHSNAYMRVFMSGTALDSNDDKTKLTMIGLSGTKLASVSKAELMDRGISTPVSVQLYLCNTLLYRPAIIYDEILENCIFYSQERVSIMANICNNSKGKVLIAVTEIHHGQFIYDNLQIQKKVEFTHGEDSKSKEKIKGFMEGDTDVLISTGILKEGVNIPIITDIIYAVGGKSKISIKQWMGRAERLCAGKEMATFHDFYDIGKYIKKHSESRMRVYSDEGLPVLSNFSLKDARKLSTIIVH